MERVAHWRQIRSDGEGQQVRLERERSALGGRVHCQYSGLQALTRLVGSQVLQSAHMLVISVRLHLLYLMKPALLCKRALSIRLVTPLAPVSRTLK